MKSAVITSLFAALCAASGCANTSEGVNNSEVRVSVITNTLKCDFARYFAYERAHLGPPFIIENGSPISAVLTLNVVNEQSAGGGVGVDSSVLTFGSGGGVGVGVSGSVKRTNTVIRKMAVQITPTSDDTSICDLAGDRKLANGIGVYNWLVNIRTDMGEAIKGSPLVLVDQLEYSTDFAVEKKTTQRADLFFLPLKGNLELTQTRSDVQKLEIKISTKKQPAHGKSKAGVGRGERRPCNPMIETCPTASPPLSL